MGNARKPRIETSNSKQINWASPAGIVVAKWGGLHKMARETGIAPSTIWSWLRRSGDVPTTRIPELKIHAARLRIKLKDSDFIRQIAA